MRLFISSFLLLIISKVTAQLPVAPDTISVLSSNYCLKMPWAGGINAASFSNIDLNYDGKMDLVLYDKMNNSALGAFKCFENIGLPGETKYKYNHKLTQKFPRSYYWALLYDYDYDGKADLFCSATGGIQVYKNVGNATTGLQFVMTYSLLYSNYNPTGPPAISNIYTSPVGLPAITDIDNDGDLDILTFSPTGIHIEYHKNKSKELYGHSDSLKFELADPCWGNISENACTVNLNDCPNRPFDVSEYLKTANNRHAGACLMCLDSDSDGDKDLIIGDISCQTIEYCHNTGTIADALLSDTTKLYPNYTNQSNTTQIAMNPFPCTHYVDVDNDNVMDLVAAPNAFSGENVTSVWLYKNTSATPTVNFSFVKKNFLQEEMIEVGQMSRPILIDYNADGKKDLLIGSEGVFIGTGRKPRFHLYENIGTLAQPAFSLVSTDYANLSAVLNGSVFSAIPAPGDIDNDGDIDLFVVTNGNVISWFENTGGAGNPCNFSNFKFNHFSINFPSSNPVPQLFDFNNDGKLDLLVSTKNGRIYYYENNGTTTSPSFTLISGAFPNVALKGDFFTFGLDGFGASYFYKEASQTKMLGGCITGQIYLFDVPAIATQSCALIDSTANGILEHTYSTPWYEDVNGDGKPDLFIGNAGGGVSFYSSKATDVGIYENIFNKADLIRIFPNPTNNKVTLEAEGNTLINEIEIYNLLGEKVKTIPVNQQKLNLDISELPIGVYMFHLHVKSANESYSIVKKVMKN